MENIPNNIKEIAYQLKQKGWKETKKIIKQLLRITTGCHLQYRGWTCNKCFFSIDPKITVKEWQTILWLRGDYKEKDLPELPKKEKERFTAIAKIIKIIKKQSYGYFKRTKTL